MAQITRTIKPNAVKKNTPTNSCSPTRVNLPTIVYTSSVDFLVDTSMLIIGATWTEWSNEPWFKFRE